MIMVMTIIIVKWIEVVTSPCLQTIVRSLSAKYRPDRYRHDKSVKFGTELP